MIIYLQMKEALDPSRADVFKASFLPSFIDYNNLFFVDIMSLQVKPEGLEQSVVMIFLLSDINRFSFRNE